MCFEKQICMEWLLEGSILQMMATLLLSKAVTNGFDIKHSCENDSN